MLHHPTVDRLRELGLTAMCQSLQDLTNNPDAQSLDHLEWLGLLLEHEWSMRQQKRFELRARAAKLRHQASIEDIDFHTPRALSRQLFLSLSSCDWIRDNRHCLFTGPSEVVT